MSKEKTKIVDEYKITIRCNTVGQLKFFLQTLTGFVAASNMFAESKTGKNYKNCSVEIEKYGRNS